MEFQIDNFTINIDISGNGLMSAAMFISKMTKIVKNKIHIINYTADDIQGYFTIDESKSKEFIKNTESIIDRIVFADKPVKNFIWLNEYLNNLSTHDFVIINGAERLLRYKETVPLLNTDYLDLKTKVHFLEEENWIQLSKELDVLYEEKQNSIQGLITNIYTDSKCREVIINTLEDSENMSIISSDIVGRNEEYEDIQRELFERISKLTLSEALDEIELQKERLGDNTNYFRAMAHYNNGNISETIGILESQYDNLLNESKLMLADLQIVTNNKLRASEILNELFKKDKFLKDLFPAILRLYDSSDYEKHVYWLELALEVDPDNPAIIEHNANRYIKENQYDKAANEFRKLEKLLGQPYYELVARINDILYDGKMKNNEVGKYIYDFLTLHPKLKNEALYRLVRYYIEYQESDFLAYKVLCDCDYQLGQPRVYDLVKMKLSILKDDKKASKALGKLKPYKKEEDAKKINTERSKELINGIRILAADNKGYLVWRSFIDECQSDLAWKKSLYDRLKETILKTNELNVKAMIDQSFIRNIETIELSENLDDDITQNPDETIANAIIMLRRVKAGEFELNDNFGSFEEFSKVMLTLSEVLSNNRFRLWCRYYLSIIASILGNHQEANNYALSIFEYYDRVDENLKNHCLLLGLVSWGNSQYRLGRHSEGIASIIASVKFISLTNEIYPFVEEAINIIGRYLSDVTSDIPGRDFELWSSFHENFGSYNKAFNHIWKIKYSNNEDVITELIDSIKNSEKNDANWAGDIVNLVSIYANNNNLKNAIQIISRYYKQAVEALTIRKDVRFRILYNWSYICFTQAKTLDDYLRVLELIELADHDLDDKRKVSHKEERAGIGTQSEEIYRYYIQICSIIIGLFEIPEFLKKIMNDKIEQILPKITPRAILEQKDYYQSRVFSEESMIQKKKLELVTEEYNRLFVNNFSNIDLLSKKAEIIQELTEQLKKSHPHYLELVELKGLSFLEIQDLLREDDIFFQYVVTPLCVTVILITHDDLKIIPKLILPTEMSVQELAIKFSYTIQQSFHLNSNEIVSIIEELSSVIGNELLEVIAKNNIKKIYCMPDFKLGMFPLATVNYNGKYLIDIVDSIVNIIDYRILGEMKKIDSINQISNRIFGNLQDSELKKINKWLENCKNDSFVLLKNESDEVESLGSISHISGMNTVAIYGHGISDPNGNIIDGAKGIEGKKSIIDLNDVIEKITSMDNLIVISCSGGSPNYENVENSFGTWSSIFERFTGNILSCKWDVPTDSTIELMREFYIQTMENKVPVDRALLIAQRKTKEKYENPKYWAGIEFWIN